MDCEGISLYRLQGSLTLSLKWRLHVCTALLQPAFHPHTLLCLPTCAEAQPPGTPPLPHNTAWSSCRREHQGHRRGCKFCYKLILLVHFLGPSPSVLSSSSHFPQQCPKQLNTCCRGSQTSLPLTGASTRWLTFWVLEPRPGSPADRLP